MIRKDKKILIGLLLFIISLVITFLFMGIPSDEDCPAPENLESMDVYQYLHDAIHNGSTPTDAITAFSQMCDIPVDCRSDMILVEYSLFPDSDTYYLHLVRQFEFSDSLEFVQLHVDIGFSASEMTTIPHDSVWYTTGQTDILTILTNCEGFQTVSDLTPSYVNVFIDWTWS